MRPSERALAVIVMLSATQTATAAETVLAEGRRSLLPIVLLRDAPDRQKELAAELADLLGRMSGATFRVTAGDGSTGIVLGTVGQLAVPEWKEALRVDGHDGKEAYGIRSNGKRVLILGATDLGLDRGITRVLEKLGCRWFFPSAAWHIIPHPERLAVDIDMTDRPALVSRVIWWDWGPWDARAREDHRQWMRRNWMGESLRIYCGHAWQRIYREHKAVFDAHPEYLALRKIEDNETGRIRHVRDAGSMKFCVSNAGLVDLCKQYAVSFFDKNPDDDMVSMEPSDGGGHCECDKCLAMGSVSDRVHTLVNEAAKAVAEKHPGKLVGAYAYNVHSEPPRFRMAPNVYVQITAGFTRGRYTFLELIDEWPKHVSQLGIYEYFAVWAWGRDMPGRPRGSDLAYLAERIPYYAARKATTMSCESGANYGVNGLGYLVASRLMWDPKADVEAVCRDFCAKAFGPAAEPMRRYYERFDAGRKPLTSDHLLALAHRDVAEASRLAASRPDVLGRLDDVKLYLYYVRLMRSLEMATAKDERLRLVYALLNFAYRTRRRYIVHSTGIRGRAYTYYLRGVEPPEEWDYRRMGKRTAWYTGDDFAHDEVETLFAEGRAQLRIAKFQERTFSDDLVHAGFKPWPKGEPARLCFQRGEPFVMQSLEGEALEFRLLTGVIAHYRDRRPTQWRVASTGDQVVAKGELPLDGQWHAIRVVVPAAGTYAFRIDDFGAGWQIDYEAGKPYAWTPERGRRAYSLGSLGSLYFYVPKGTSEVAYFVEGSAHTVVDGAGREVRKVERQPGNVIVLPVPPGCDGRPWCIKGLRRTQLWFYNCPNVLAAHPEDLLVPREALER